MKYIYCILAFVIVLSISTRAQNNRINTTNNIGWYNYFGTIRLSPKVGLHTEYQWRRNNFITEWQQSLLRLGVNYKAGENVILRAGYGWIETWPYGELPLNGAGRDFTEHRIFEMIQLSDNIGRSEWSHRWMLEQRWVGRYSTPEKSTEDEFPLLHRLRYMARVQFPLKGSSIKDQTPYLAIYDEIFIGFGENVNANVFDQNRLGILFGYRFNSLMRIEGGYLNQIVQYGRQLNGKNIFQYNHGLIVNILIQASLFSRP
jgi:hypothetical protein